MAAREKTKQGSAAAAVLLAADAKKKSVPVWLARNARWVREAPLSEAQRTWVEAQGFKGAARKHVLLPGPDGALAGAVLGLGEERAGDPMEKPELAVGLLPAILPPGCYHLADELGSPSWRPSPGVSAPTASGATSRPAATTRATEGPARRRSCQRARPDRAVWLGRDLINTPASDMGPQELEDAARQLAKTHGAAVSSIVGDDLLAKNFPLIHAVGRASPRAPRLIDLTWGRAGPAGSRSRSSARASPSIPAASTSSRRAAC